VSNPSVGCAVLHQDAEGNPVPCPGYHTKKHISTESEPAVEILDPEAPHPAAQNPLHRLATMRQIVESTKLKDAHRAFEPTGKFFILCNCGFASGWIGPDEFTKELVAEHTGDPDVRGYAEVVAELEQATQDLKKARADYSDLVSRITTVVESNQ
jgi:hypothetical protein